MAYPGYVSPVFVDNELREILAQSIARDEARKAADEREEKEYATVIRAKPRSFTLLRRLPERRDERLRERFSGVEAC
jgi:hypothetical protein